MYVEEIISIISFKYEANPQKSSFENKIFKLGTSHYVFVGTAKVVHDSTVKLAFSALFY